MLLLLLSKKQISPQQPSPNLHTIKVQMLLQDACSEKDEDEIAEV